MCACVARFSGRGASVLAFLGERIPLVVVRGGRSVGSGAGRLVRGVGDGMLFRVGLQGVFGGGWWVGWV
jgi:hypothetical protein